MPQPSAVRPRAALPRLSPVMSTSKDTGVSGLSPEWQNRLCPALQNWPSAHALPRKVPSMAHEGVELSQLHRA
jgi:hypothetical protein